MKEASSVYQKGFTVGLRPFSYVGPTFECLVRCLNLLPTQAGLEPREEIVQPVNSEPADIFPFPFLYAGEDWILLFLSTSLYYIDSSWSPIFVSNVAWGGVPHIADFKDYLVIASPGGTWEFKGGTLTPGAGGASFRTCCDFRGQLIVGNGYLPSGPERMPDDTVQPGGVSVSRNSLVGWSRIGAVDWEFTLGNEVGWAIVPYIGEVLAILPLGDKLFVYGENGVMRMTPQIEPTVAFGFEKFGEPGLLNRDCVAGDNVNHLYVGADQELYRVSGEAPLSGQGKVPERLGYKEWISQLSSPIVTFDPQRREWWIGDTSRCFIYNGQGLGEASETPTHLGRLNGTLIGYSVKHTPPAAVVKTTGISLNYRGLKTIMCIESDLATSGQTVGIIDGTYSYDRRPGFERKIRLDPRGAFFPIMSASEFQIGWECPVWQDFYLSKAWIRYKTTDKTFARGIINAGSAEEQGNS